MFRCSYHKWIVAAALGVAAITASGAWASETHDGHHGGHGGSHGGGHHGAGHHGGHGGHGEHHGGHGEVHHGGHHYSAHAPHHGHHAVHHGHHSGIHVDLGHPHFGVSVHLGSRLRYSYVRCGDCGVSYRSGYAHVCDAPVVYDYGSRITYVRCDDCSVSYRTTRRHVCRGATSTRQTARVAVRPELPGWALLRAEKSDEALRSFEQALADNPNDASAYIGQALTLGMAGKDSEAIAAMIRALEIDPRSPLDVPSDEATKSMVAHLTGVYRKHAAAAEHPGQAWLMVAALELARGEYNAAQSALDRAAEDDHGQPAMLESLRQVIREQKR